MLFLQFSKKKKRIFIFSKPISHQVRKCANFAYNKNSSFLGLHHLLIKKKTIFYISCTKRDSSSIIPTIYCHLKRIPSWTRNSESLHNLYPSISLLLSYLSTRIYHLPIIYLYNTYIHTHPSIYQNFLSIFITIYLSSYPAMSLFGHLFTIPVTRFRVLTFSQRPHSA